MRKEGERLYTEVLETLCSLELLRSDRSMMRKRMLNAALLVAAFIAQWQTEGKFISMLSANFSGLYVHVSLKRNMTKGGVAGLLAGRAPPSFCCTLVCTSLYACSRCGAVVRDSGSS